MADADGEALRGGEVRYRLREDYGIELSKAGNGRCDSQNHKVIPPLVNSEWLDESELDGNARHVSHQLKPEYIDKVREQLH